MSCIVVLIAAGASLNSIDLAKIKSYKHVGTNLLHLLECVVDDNNDDDYDNGDKRTYITNTKKERAKTAAGQTKHRRKINSIGCSSPTSPLRKKRNQYKTI